MLAIMSACARQIYDLDYSLFARVHARDVHIVVVPTLTARMPLYVHTAHVLRIMHECKVHCMIERTRVH